MQEVNINENFLDYAPSNNIPTTEDGYYYDDGLVLYSRVEEWFYITESIQNIISSKRLSFEIVFSFQQESSQSLEGFAFSWVSSESNYRYGITLFNDGEYSINYEVIDDATKSMVHVQNATFKNFNLENVSLKFEKFDDSIDTGTYILFDDEVVFKEELHFDNIDRFTYGVANGRIIVKAFQFNYFTDEACAIGDKNDTGISEKTEPYSPDNKGSKNSSIQKQFDDAFAESSHYIQNYILGDEFDHDVKYICSKNNLNLEKLEISLQNVCCSLLVGLLRIEDVKDVIIETFKIDEHDVSEAEAENIVFDIKEVILTDELIDNM